MSGAILAVDVGTSTVRTTVIGARGQVLADASSRCPLVYPGPGLVEQDAEALWLAVQATMREVVDRSDLGAQDIAGIGVSAQRATLVIWDPVSSAPLHGLVSWQDLRGAERAAELADAGFLLSHMQPACKLELVLDAIPEGRRRMASGELVWGGVESFIIARLTGARRHFTDASHAQATAYYDYETGAWDARLLELQGLDLRMFPTLCDSSADFGVTHPGILGAPVPILAVLGDQQAACFAQGCRAPGDGKVTYGTSATANVHVGEKIIVTEGGYPALLWRRGSVDSYSVEGMVLTAGATFDHLVELGVLDSVSNASAVAASVEPGHGVALLPALQGLGSPFMDPTRVASMHGLTRGSTAAHIVRAATEGVCFRIRQVLDNQFEQTQLPWPAAVRVDGGASVNDTLMQVQADVLGRPVERMSPLEATVHGVGMLAGIRAGLWDDTQVQELRSIDRTFQPRLSEDERESRFQTWRKACSLSLADA